MAMVTTLSSEVQNKKKKKKKASQNPKIQELRARVYTQMPSLGSGTNGMRSQGMYKKWTRNGEVGPEWLL